MESFEVEVGVGRVGDGELIPVSATVDTGAPHSVMPESLLRGLGVSPAEYHTLIMADVSKHLREQMVGRNVREIPEGDC